MSRPPQHPATVLIGEFSRWTHLSVKALRHYHDVGVLVPAAIDPSSGYRRYSAEQMADAHLVRRLRDLDVPLDQIRAVMQADGDVTRERLLAEHLHRLERQLEHTQAVVTSLRQLLRSSAPEPDVQVRQVPAQHVVAERATVASGAIEAWSVTTFMRLAVAAGDAVRGSGSLFAAPFFRDGAGEVTAFVVVDAAFPGAVELPGGTYASAVHEGSYADLDLTYGALGARVAAELPLGDGPIREHYLLGPGDVDEPARYRTEVLWPLAGSAGSAGE